GKSIEYHSDTVAKVVSSINPTWPDADKAEFTLYSDRISPPSATVYDGSHVKSMIVDIGAPPPNSDGTYYC
ncbi:hypothetical protein, partial [Streptomyces sp. NPDC059071]|uniref:hypothetical protein n=1 Tax=Streptomyces sp. NPDC059071 TaxID=3346714 RepID=UPI00368BB662